MRFAKCKMDMKNNMAFETLMLCAVNDKSKKHKVEDRENG